MTTDLLDLQRQAAINVIARLLVVHESRDPETAAIIANQMLTIAMEDLVVASLPGPLLTPRGLNAL